MTFLNNYLPVINIVLALCLTIGGILAVRQGYSKQAGEIQERVIGALQVEVETLEKKVASCEEEIVRLKQGYEAEILHLKQIIDTTQNALKAHGIAITINGELVTIDGGSLPRRRSSHQQSSNTPNTRKDSSA